MLPPSLAVVLVLGLLCGLLWLARRQGLAAFAGRLPAAGRAGKQMRVVERVPLAGQHSLHLVACAGRWLIVAVSPGGCRTVAEFAEPGLDQTGRAPEETAAAAGRGV